MSKRRPTSDLNHDNWNEELPEEEKGSFQMAGQAELQTRKILKPRRKLPQSDAAPSNPFQSLGAFASLEVPPAAQPVLVVPTISTTGDKSLQTGTASFEPQPHEPSDLQNQNGNSVDLEKTLGKSNTEDTNLSVQDNVSDTPNLVQPLGDSSDGQANDTVGETEVEGKGSNNIENSTEELDLPDFVDQSDDEEERERENKKMSDLDDPDADNPDTE